jgi:hypothetical protein
MKAKKPIQDICPVCLSELPGTFRGSWCLLLLKELMLEERNLSKRFSVARAGVHDPSD